RPWREFIDGSSSRVDVRTDLRSLVRVVERGEISRTLQASGGRGALQFSGKRSAGWKEVRQIPFHDHERLLHHQTAVHGLRRFVPETHRAVKDSVDRRQHDRKRRDGDKDFEQRETLRAQASPATSLWKKHAEV